jgi:hypothetical protein
MAPAAQRGQYRVSGVTASWAAGIVIVQCSQQPK